MLLFYLLNNSPFSGAIACVQRQRYQCKHNKVEHNLTYKVEVNGLAIPNITGSNCSMHHARQG